MAVSKAQQRATAKYIKANYDRMEIVVPKGTRDTIKAHAAAQGESVGAFIKRAIDHEMERDGLKRPQDGLRCPAEDAEERDGIPHLEEQKPPRVAAEAIGRG